jgi:hypothetical protein
MDLKGLWNRFSNGLGAIGFTPLGLVLLIVLALLPFIPPFDQEHILRWLIMGAFLAAQSVAFDFTAGYINVVNFGFAAILGAGAYTSAVLANTSPVLAIQPGLSPWIGIWAGALLAGLIGFGVGILTLRLRGIFAAVLAWFVGIALLGVANNLVDITRGPLGMAPRPFLETTSNRPYFYIILAMLLVVYITLQLVVRSRFGLAFKAIGHQPHLLPGVQLYAVSLFRGLVGGLLRPLLWLADAANAHAHVQDGRGTGSGLHRRPRQLVGWHGHCLSLCLWDRSPALEPD